MLPGKGSRWGSWESSPSGRARFSPTLGSLKHWREGLSVSKGPQTGGRSCEAMKRPLPRGHGGCSHESGGVEDRPHEPWPPPSKLGGHGAGVSLGATRPPGTDLGGEAERGSWKGWGLSPDSTPDSPWEGEENSPCSSVLCRPHLSAPGCSSERTSREGAAHPGEGGLGS